MYDKLKKIKRPVLIEVVANQPVYSWRNRFRILYPDGKCEYTTFGSERDCLNPSCFAYDRYNGDNNPDFYKLGRVVKRMRTYDIRFKLKIVKIIEL